jgi:hypothetical protein
VPTTLFEEQLDYVARYDVARAWLRSARAWPMPRRLAWCKTILEKVDVFRDTFTTRQYFATHRLLVTEHLIDAVTDRVSVRADRRRAFLEAEELTTRRRILADWRQTCGP